MGVASATSPTTNQDVVAAMCGIIADVAERVRKELALGDVRDISLRCSMGKAVFKRVGARGDDVLIIGAIMPKNVRCLMRYCPRWWPRTFGLRIAISVPAVS